MEGWGPKSSVCPSKPRKTKLFGRISRDFGRVVPGAPEKLERKKICVQFLAPKKSGPGEGVRRGSGPE